MVQSVRRGDFCLFEFAMALRNAIMCGLGAIAIRTRLVLGVDPVMWMDKLAAGVLRVQTQIGPRYVGLTFRERVFLLWIFRHFDNLQHQALPGWQQRFIERLCVEHQFIAMPHQNWNESPLIGTIERRPLGPEPLPGKRLAESLADPASSPAWATRQRS